jgi:2-polyprenyl-3-methyl-5-hydroxy-6-metoxy-1,4-benzoquinol methylase
MTEFVEHCPLCGAATNVLFDRREFKSYLVTNVLCRNCGLVYQSPRMTEVESQAFYKAEYRLLYQGQEGPNPKDLAVQSARAQIILKFIGEAVGSADRMLDIGCSAGKLLQQFRIEKQAQVYGVEPGIIYRQYAQSLGLPIFSSLDELRAAGLPRFNLVSMMHVLEHMPEPVEYLQNLRTDFLEPGGWVLLEVPNLYAHDCFEVAHLVSFSAHTIAQVVQKAGFRVIRLRAQGQPRSHLIPLYLTLLAQPDESVHYSLKPDRMVRLKRRYGFFCRHLAERLSPQRAWIPISSI